MKTLVIHPKDPSTDFLSAIYQDLDALVINAPIPNSMLKMLIKEHDRIIMLGHGTPNGLLGYDGYVIDSSFAGILREKQDNVHIWCNADQFVYMHDLKGFTTGMIISENIEALYCGVTGYGENDVEESNKLFADTIKEALYEYKTDSKLIVESVKRNYVNKANPVINYNNQNIYLF